MIRVALANDYEIVVEGLRAMLTPYAREIVIADLLAGGGPERAVDVTLFDTYGHQGALFELVRALVEDPRAGAVVVFSFATRTWSEATMQELGVAGFIAKTAAVHDIVGGLKAAAGGERVRVVRTRRTSSAVPEVRWPGRSRGLTDRESELLALLPTGMTNAELAARLFVSENTIKSQLRGLYAKLGVRNRTQAAAAADGTGGILGPRRA